MLTSPTPLWTGRLEACATPAQPTNVPLICATSAQPPWAALHSRQRQAVSR